jgi:ribosomal-protein-alanine N-acetyltransferase
MTVTIEPLSSPSQIDEILAVEEASFTSPWTREMYLAVLNNTGVSYFYLARTETGQVIGFCSFWRVLDELHINNLAVLPEHRRSGIGTDLLLRVLADGSAFGAKRATLEVRRSNEAAQKLYEKFGFTVAGVRRLYYSSPPEDALVLWRGGLL